MALPKDDDLDAGKVADVLGFRLPDVEGAVRVRSPRPSLPAFLGCSCGERWEILAVLLGLIIFLSPIRLRGRMALFPPMRRVCFVFRIFVTTIRNIARDSQVSWHERAVLLQNM
jgi:hypothetical protein